MGKKVVGKDSPLLKEPLKPFFLFRQEVYLVVKSDNPDKHSLEIGEIIGQKWEKLD